YICTQRYYTIFPYTTLFRSNLFDVISRLKGTVENVRFREGIVHHTTFKEQHKLFHINTGFNRVLATRIHEIMALHYLVKSGHIRSEENTSELHSRFELVYRS